MKHRYFPLGAFVGTYMAVAGVLAARQWNREFLFYGGVMVGLIGLVVAVDRRVHLATALLWGLAVWGLVHLLGGTVGVPVTWVDPGASGTLYNVRPHAALPKYDQVVHAYGFFLCTLAAWRAMRVASAGTLRPSPGVLLAVGGVGVGLGAVNEVIEFAATRMMPETNVGGYVNTGWDLVSNLVGALIGVAVIRVAHAGAQGVAA